MQSLSLIFCCHNFLNFCYMETAGILKICHPYIRNQKKKGVCKNIRSQFRVFAVHDMNKSFTEISKEEDQDMLLNIKKAYRLAKGSMHGFQDWCIDKEINEYFYAEKEIAELEGGYLYSVFRKSFPNWMESNNLKSWKDVEIFIKGESA